MAKEKLHKTITIDSLPEEDFAAVKDAFKAEIHEIQRAFKVAVSDAAVARYGLRKYAEILRKGAADG